MIVVELDYIDDELVDSFSPRGKADWEKLLSAGVDIMVGTHKAWRVVDNVGNDIMIAGVLRFSLVGRSPNMWFVLCDAFRLNKRENLKHCLVLIEEVSSIYPRLEAFARKDSEEDQHFLRFLGFECASEIDEFYLFRKCDGN